MLLAGRSVNSVSVDGTSDGARTAIAVGADSVPAAVVAGAAVAGAVDAARTSRSTMRPPGPLPVTVRRSIPSSIASDLASGDARIVPGFGGGVAAAGAGAGAGLAAEGA